MTDPHTTIPSEVALADATYVLGWLRQSNAPENIIGLQERALAALAALVAERDEALAALKDEMAWDMGGVPENEWMARAVAAEARVTQLEKALKDIAEYEEPWPQDPSDVYDEFQSIARAALSGLEEDGGREEADR
jgi:hypothetical protein